MKDHNDFTTGNIFGPLFRFAGPILLALFLQALYGAVDLAVVGRFGASTDVSAVASGSMFMTTVTCMITALAMGTTVTMGHRLGEGRKKEAGSIIGTSICLFLLVGVIVMIVVPVCANWMAALINAPEEAFSQTVTYIRICGLGSIVIVAYNLIGSIFRGLGDSRTPMIAVAIACAFNIGGDLLFVAGFGMGTKGAAIATVIAQGVSVILSLMLIRRQTLPFTFTRSQIRWNRPIVRNVLRIGAPLALQDVLSNVSFLIMMAIGNSMGLIASAGMGVGDKLCGFIMLVPSAFSQTMSAFVAQNFGARRFDRARRSLLYAILVSLAIGVVMFYLSFFHGDLLAGIFSNDPEVIAATALYLKAYAFDCILTAPLFCFIGFYNGMGMTKFVMAQTLTGAFAVRIPIAFAMSLRPDATLFHIGIATPISSVAQIIMCLFFYIYARKHRMEGSLKKDIPSAEAAPPTTGADTEEKASADKVEKVAVDGCPDDGKCDTMNQTKDF